LASNESDEAADFVLFGIGQILLAAFGVDVDQDKGLDVFHSARVDLGILLRN
jgi:hypothetical protein